MATEKVVLTAVDETPEDGNVEGKKNWKLFKMMKKERKKTFPKKRRVEDEYPDVVEVSAAALARHSNAAVNIKPEAMRSALQTKKFAKKKQKMMESIEKTARAELLNEEEQGFIKPDDGEFTYNIRQSEIVANVDIASASKRFDLNLEQFGPYRTDFSRNGRFLALAGRKGHVAVLDWHTKKLQFETNVMETVRDVQFLHTELMVAVSQKNYTYIYDQAGVELHCLKSLFQTLNLEFLPHHFLLVAGTKTSFLHFVDTSVGQMVASYRTGRGPLNVMTQNPANAIIHTGHGDGTVSLWSPTVKEPLVRMLAHPCTLSGIAVDETGNYMYTSGIDNKCRVWDVRTFRHLHTYNMPRGLTHIAVSQRHALAAVCGNTVQIYRDLESGVCSDPYLTHRFPCSVASLNFVPFEDVLGVGHDHGFSSILVPGSGEANVDALRNNPYETKRQRREREVKQLLDKIPAEMICLDADAVTQVNTEALEEEIEKKKSILWTKAPQIEYTVKNKAKGRGGGVKNAKNKEELQAEARKKHNLERRAMEKELFVEGEETQTQDKPKSVLDRFKKKKG